MQTWESFDNWHQQLRDLGYQTLVRKLDAHDFGVPQNRRRLFIIADNQRKPLEPRRYRKQTATIGSVLRKVERGGQKFTLRALSSSRHADATLKRARRAIKDVGAGTPFLMVYYGSDGAGGFQRLDRPLRTVTTLDRFALLQPNCLGHEIRMLQPIELALAMGFPQNFRWPVGITRRNKIKLIGNAVCPPVMAAIIRSLSRDT
jgi:DNA (cytosine-5)-methyltransferase 1